MKQIKYFAPLLGFLLCSHILLPRVGAQDFAGEKLGGGFLYSQERSASHGQLVKQATRLMYAGISDLQIDVGVYEFNGSFEEAVGRIPVPQDADVSGISEQYSGSGLGFFLAMFENEPGLDSEWLEAAQSAATRWEDSRYRSYKVSQGENTFKGDAELSPGDSVEIFSIECQSPFIDYGNLQIVQGTWVIATRTRFTIPDQPGGTDDSDFDWDEEDSGDAGEPGVAVFPGAKPVDPDETMYREFFGDRNYLVEKSPEILKEFYLNLDGKYCAIDDESPMAFEEGEFMMTSLLCLDHEGEPRAGDNVIVITLFKAPPQILSDLIGRNQGNWTVVVFNSWLEEDY